MHRGYFLISVAPCLPFVSTFPYRSHRVCRHGRGRRLLVVPPAGAADRDRRCGARRGLKNWPAPVAAMRPARKPMPGVDAGKNGIATSNVQPVGSPPASSVFLPATPARSPMQISTTNNAAFFARIFEASRIMPETTQATAQASNLRFGMHLFAQHDLPIEHERRGHHRAQLRRVDQRHDELPRLNGDLTDDWLRRFGAQRKQGEVYRSDSRTDAPGRRSLPGDRRLLLPGEQSAVVFLRELFEQ